MFVVDNIPLSILLTIFAKKDIPLSIILKILQKQISRFQ